jgi:hypothetical protein
MIYANLRGGCKLSQVGPTKKRGLVKALSPKFEVLTSSSSWMRFLDRLEKCHGTSTRRFELVFGISTCRYTTQRFKGALWCASTVGLNGEFLEGLMLAPVRTISEGERVRGDERVRPVFNHTLLGYRPVYRDRVCLSFVIRRSI